MLRAVATFLTVYFWDGGVLILIVIRAGLGRSSHLSATMGDHIYIHIHILPLSIRDDRYLKWVHEVVAFYLHDFRVFCT